MFREISRLGPGCYMTVNDGSQRVHPFWSIAQVRPVEDPYRAAVGEVQRRLRRAVRSHLVSDVPIGVFLSGGIDSSAITALAAEELGDGLMTFSVAFDFQDTNELPYARWIAERYRTRHEELMINAPAARDLIPVLIRCYDEPFSDAANIPLYLLAQHLDRRVKVVLQGDGGDELFGGYPRYEWLRLAKLPWFGARYASRRLHATSSRLPAVVRRTARVIEALGAPGEKRFALLLTVETEQAPPTQVLAREFREIVDRSNPFQRYRQVLAEVDGEDAVQSMLRTDAKIILPDTFLEKVDKATMAHGIEARVPFLDNGLVEYALGLPSKYKVMIGQKKRILRSALRGIVPDAILDRPKTGFGVPYQRWLRGPLRDFLLESLRESRARQDRILDFDTIAGLSRDHASGGADHGFILWKTLNFALWYEHYGVSA
jgi:asparagine synthase (glutamine-hydrolysing)